MSNKQQQNGGRHSMFTEEQSQIIMNDLDSSGDKRVIIEKLRKKFNNEFTYTQIYDHHRYNKQKQKKQQQQQQSNTDDDSSANGESASLDVADANAVTDDRPDSWDGATRRYDERIERVEARKTDEEKFGVTRETAKQYRQEALNLYEKRLRQQQLIPSIICEEYL